MQSIRHEIAVHGNAVRAAPDVRVTHHPDRASISMSSPRDIYFPIPTPAIVDGQRLAAGKIWIRFRTYERPSASSISAISVFDGEKSIFERNVDVKGTVDGQVAFEFPARVEVSLGGLNVTLRVAGQGGLSIDIMSVSIAFY